MVLRHYQGGFHGEERLNIKVGLPWPAELSGQRWTGHFRTVVPYRYRVLKFQRAYGHYGNVVRTGVGMRCFRSCHQWGVRDPLCGHGRGCLHAISEHSLFLQVTPRLPYPTATQVSCRCGCRYRPRCGQRWHRSRINVDDGY